jgi:hypothetical protein
MSSQPNNIAIYIKRAELDCTKEYIINAFNSQQYGKVKDVQFIQKTNDHGVSYNGVIVIFDIWFMNSKVTKLFNDMSKSQDGSGKIFHDTYKNKYWFVNEFKPKTEVNITTEVDVIQTINKTINEKEKIKQLEDLVRSLSSQMIYMQTQLEKNELKMMEYEDEKTRQLIQSIGIKGMVFDLEIEMEWNEKEYQKNFQIEKERADNMQCKLACLAIDYAKKECECETLKIENDDLSNIIKYYNSY